MKSVRVCGRHRQRDCLVALQAEIRQRAFDHSPADASTMVSRVNRDLSGEQRGVTLHFLEIQRNVDNLKTAPLMITGYRGGVILTGA